MENECEFHGAKESFVKWIFKNSISVPFVSWALLRHSKSSWVQLFGERSKKIVMTFKKFIIACNLIPQLLVQEK
jgi:hypothetical protein